MVVLVELPSSPSLDEINNSNLVEVPVRLGFEEEEFTSNLGEPPKSKTPKIRTPKSPKTPLTNERIKGILESVESIPNNELPSNLSESTSRFYHGHHAHLPSGWLIEQRPRTNEKYAGKLDQFFYEPVSGKQFRSLKAVMKHISDPSSSSVKPQDPSPSNPTADLGPEKLNKSEEAAEVQGTGSYPWDEMKKKNKRKRGENHPRPPPKFNFQRPPKSVSWSLESADEDIWIPEFENSSKNPHKIRDKWYKVFMSMNANPNLVEMLSADEIGAAQTNLFVAEECGTANPNAAEVFSAEEIGAAQTKISDAQERGAAETDQDAL